MPFAKRPNESLPLVTPKPETLGGPSPLDGTGDWYLESGYLVFTEAHHLKRGSCCGNGCRHCPYQPKHQAGTQTVRLD
jgi:hypothetical protein